MKKILFVTVAVALLMPVTAYAAKEDPQMPLAEDAGALGPMNATWVFIVYREEIIEQNQGTTIQQSNRDPVKMFEKMQAEELLGKIGPCVEPYNPEADNRLIQEF